MATGMFLCNRIRLCALSFAFGALVSLSFASSTAPKSGPSAEQALQLLAEGNGRFVAGKLVHPNQDAWRRTELAGGQKPFAIVLTCADSRVAPELYFDRGLGDIFVLRNAGNVIDDHVLGSIEYAVEHLGAPLVVVVGHSSCGAVAATVAGGAAPGHIGSVVSSIAPALEAAAHAEDKVDAVVRAHAKRVAQAIADSDPILKKAVAAGHLQVVAARYDLATGKVEFLGEKAPAKHAH